MTPVRLYSAAPSVSSPALYHCAPSKYKINGSRSAVGNISDYRCVSVCKSRARKFDTARSQTFAEIDHEIICLVILPPSADSKRVVVSYKRKYAHEVLVNHLVKLAQDKSMVR